MEFDVAVAVVLDALLLVRRLRHFDQNKRNLASLVVKIDTKVLSSKALSD